MTSEVDVGGMPVKVGLSHSNNVGKFCFHVTGDSKEAEK